MSSNDSPSEEFDTDTPGSHTPELGNFSLTTHKIKIMKFVTQILRGSKNNFDTELLIQIYLDGRMRFQCNGNSILAHAQVGSDSWLYKSQVDSEPIHIPQEYRSFFVRPDNKDSDYISCVVDRKKFTDALEPKSNIVSFQGRTQDNYVSVISFIDNSIITERVAHVTNPVELLNPNGGMPTMHIRNIPLSITASVYQRMGKEFFIDVQNHNIDGENTPQVLYTSDEAGGHYVELHHPISAHDYASFSQHEFKRVKLSKNACGILHYASGCPDVNTMNLEFICNNNGTVCMVCFKIQAFRHHAGPGESNQDTFGHVYVATQVE